MNHIMCTGTQLAQHGAKKAVRLYGKPAIDALISECRQIDRKDAIHPFLRKDLTTDELERVLSAITMVKIKRCGKVKGRTVADGSKQREYTDKVEATASTLSNESFFITTAIEAVERRVVATADIEGAYLDAIMKKRIFLVYKGDMVDYLVAANPPKYGPFVHITKHGKKQLYVRLN